MNKRRGFALCVPLLCGLLLAGLALAQNSVSYDLAWNVITGGGGPRGLTSYAINSTIGQAAIGPMSSSSYRLGAGYWYGVAVSAPRPTPVATLLLPIIMKGCAP